jgi:FimV-like protein
LERSAIPAVAAVVAAIVAALLVVLVALGVSRRRRRAAPAVGARGGASGAASPFAGDESARAPAVNVATTDDPIEAEFLAILARNPSSKRALMGLAGHYAERKNVAGFDEIAQRIYRLSGGRGPNWTHVASIGRQLDPDNPLFALAAGETDETALPSADEAGVAAAPIAEPHGVAPPSEGPSSTEAAAPAATELPSEVRSEVSPEVPPEVPSEAPPAAEPAPSDAVPFEPQAAHPAGHVDAEAPQPEEAQPVRSELPEPAKSPEPKTAAAPGGEATLPPEAIAALDGLDIGLPPRLGPVTGSPPYLAEVRPEEPEDEEQEKHEGAPEGAPAADAQVAPMPAPTDDAERTEKAEHPAQAAPAAHEARPAVTGLGSAPVGRLNLSFDLNLPGTQTEGQTGDGEPSDIAPTPQFTPEQLARIARNKLDLAAEYIALGDLGGARTLIHEVIESNDAATHAEAHAMLATLAPLS